MIGYTGVLKDKVLHFNKNVYLLAVEAPFLFQNSIKQNKITLLCLIVVSYTVVVKVIFMRTEAE